MKRTAKWHRQVTLKEMRHLLDFDMLTLGRFKRMRERQVAIQKRIGNEPCQVCGAIERKLREAGVWK